MLFTVNNFFNLQSSNDELQQPKVLFRKDKLFDKLPAKVKIVEFEGVHIIRFDQMKMF